MYSIVPTPFLYWFIFPTTSILIGSCACKNDYSKLLKKIIDIKHKFLFLFGSTFEIIGQKYMYLCSLRLYDFIVILFYLFLWYRWLKEAEESISDWNGGVLYTASAASSGPMKIITSIFSSDSVFNLRREDDTLQDSHNGEVGISGRDYALVPGETWLQALKWLVAIIYVTGFSFEVLGSE